MLKTAPQCLLGTRTLHINVSASVPHSRTNSQRILASRRNIPSCLLTCQPVEDLSDRTSARHFALERRRCRQRCSLIQSGPSSAGEEKAPTSCWDNSAARRRRPCARRSRAEHFLRAYTTNSEKYPYIHTTPFNTQRYKHKVKKVKE